MAAISEQQTNVLRLALLLNDKGTEALNEELVFQLFNSCIQERKTCLRNYLSTAQYGKMFSGHRCPRLSEISDDVLKIISINVFSLPEIRRDADIRKLLRKHLEGVMLNNFLSKHSQQIRSKRKVLGKKQLAVLYPTAKIKDLDITLICFLLFDFFHIKPTGSLEQLPFPSNTRLGDDILRLRLYRNKISHINNTGFCQAEFETAWDDVSGAIIRLLDVHCKSDIDVIKIKSIDGPLLSEYQQLVEEWHQDDKDLCSMVGQLTKSIQDESKRAGHREYQSRVRSNQQMKELFKWQTKVIQRMFEKSKDEVEKEVKRQSHHTLYFDNRKDWLRACHVLEQNSIPFKSQKVSSVSRSQSTRCSKDPEAAIGLQGRKEDIDKKTIPHKMERSKRRWTSPDPNTVQELFGPEVADAVNDVASSMLSLVSLSQFMIHTPTSSLDSGENMQIDSFGDRLFPPTFFGETLNPTEDISANHVESLEKPSATVSVKTESDVYKRDRKLERRKLRKMEPQLVDTYYETDSSVHMCSDLAIGLENDNTISSSTISANSRFRESQRSSHHHQQSNRWATHPVSQSTIAGRTRKDRNRSKTITSESLVPFISIRRKLEERYPLDLNKIASSTEDHCVTYSQSMDEGKEKPPNNSSVGKENPPNNSSVMMTRSKHRTPITPMSNVSGLLDTLVGCIAKPCTR